MKSFIAAMVLLSVSFSYTFAWDEVYKKNTPKKMEDREVIYYDHRLELEVEDGIVEAEWEEFDEEGFDWFKLVYSTTNSKPVYPLDKTIFVWNENQTETSFKLQSGSTHYVRLCAVVLNDDYSKDRYCGEVQKLEYSNDISTNKSQKKVIAKKVQNVSEKKSYEKKKNLELSSAVKMRVDEVIEMFMERLLENNYTDGEIVSTIDTVLDRLEVYENKDAYKVLAAYMRKVLEEYRVKYDNPLQELEDIFSDF